MNARILVAVQTMLLRVIITLAHTHVPVLWATGQTTKTAVKVTLKNIFYSPSLYNVGDNRSLIRAYP